MTPQEQPEPIRSNTRLRAVIVDGVLRVEIGVNTLAFAVAFSDWANPWSDAANDYQRTFAIANCDEFAKDVMLAMVDEAEDGSSPLTRFIDAACQAAVNDGSMGLLDREVTLAYGTFHECEKDGSASEEVSE